MLRREGYLRCEAFLIMIKRLDKEITEVKAMEDMLIGGCSESVKRISRVPSVARFLLPLFWMKSTRLSDFRMGIK